MRYVFFLISVLYSFIFYLFYTFSGKKDLFLNSIESNKNIVNLSIFDEIIFSNHETIIIQSLSGNLIFEVIIFFLIGLFLFSYFSVLEKRKRKEIGDNKDTEDKQIKNNIIRIIKNFSYYAGFILFYLSLYVIARSFGSINFSVFVFIINIIIYLFFFITKFSNISRDFLKMNSIIFSIFYMVNYIYILIINTNYFKLIDFINSFLILLIFPILLYYDKRIQKKNYFDSVILVHFSFYVFIFFLFYSYFYLLYQNLTFWISFISALFGILWFEFLSRIDFLKKDKITLRYIGILFSYIGIVFGVVYLSIFSFSLTIFLILLLQSIHNALIHKKYTNYISFFLAMFLFTYLFYYLIIYFNLVDYRSLNFLVLSLIISFSMIVFTYFVKFEIFFSSYVIHFFSYLINLMAVVIFFMFNNFELIRIGVLLLVESIYFFLSYYKLNLLKNDNKTGK